MELSKLISEQIERDRKRGFAVDFSDEQELEDQLMHDLVGLIGEVGEFANLLKKISLARRTEGYNGPSLLESTPSLREELADATIYIFRLATMLGANLEQDILDKMLKNDKRYHSLER